MRHTRTSGSASRPANSGGCPLAVTVLRPRRAAGVVAALVALVVGSVLSGCASRAGNPATHSTAAASSYTLIKEPDQGYVPVYDLIATATKTLDMTMYSLVDPKAESALIAAAKRGVAVRVLLDGDPAQNGREMNQPAYTELTANGVTVHWSWSGVLWHQKSIVIDGKTVAIMTTNLNAQYYPTLRDFIVVTDNPATVAGIEATFTTDFTHTSSPPSTGTVPPGSQLIWSPGAESGLTRLIGTARPGTTIYTENEQLASPVIEQALIAAVKRGVTVNLAMTNTPPFVAGFNTLVAGGVHVNLYAANAPLYIQAKTLSVNDDTVYVGSINFITSSTNADRNVGIITTNPTVVKGIIATMTTDFEKATPYLAK